MPKRTWKEQVEENREGMFVQVGCTFTIKLDCLR